MDQKPWKLTNANGDVDPTLTGYQYAIRTTTALRAKTIQQKFFEIAPADYVPVIPGEGAWMQEIRSNLEYSISGDFEGGIINTGQNQSQLANVDVAMSNKNAKIKTWAKGYEYSIPELELALASTNWDVVAGKTRALKKNWDLGIQKVTFLGMLTDTLVPGLLTNSDITIDTTTIPANLSSLSADDFQTFVANVLAVYRRNANFTAWPNRFVVPEDDWTGLATATSAGFPIVDKITYMENFFKKITGRADFRIMPLAYGNAAQNAGFVSANGKFRYVLYNEDAETMRMDIPVPFQFINPTPRAISFEGAGVGQFTGLVIYRPREVIYFDHT
jgi:hypothetical protein